MVNKIFDLKYNNTDILEKKEGSEIYDLASIKELLTTSDQYLLSINESEESYDCSILISAYNGSKYIKEAIRSIAGQITEHKIETVVVLDKGTTDSTLDELISYAMMNKDQSFKIAFLNHITDFREKLVSPSLTATNYIFYLDYDNTFEPSKVQKQIDDITNNSKPFSFTNLRIMDEMGNLSATPQYLTSPDFTLTGLVKGNKIDMSTICITRSFYNKYVIPIIPFLKDRFFDLCLPDYLLALVASQDSLIIYDPEPLLNYRVHKNNLFYLSGDSKNFDFMVKKSLVYERINKTITAFSLVSAALFGFRGIFLKFSAIDTKIPMVLSTNLLIRGRKTVIARVLAKIQNIYLAKKEG